MLLLLTPYEPFVSYNRRPRAPEITNPAGQRRSSSILVPRTGQLNKEAEEVELGQPTASVSRGLNLPPRKVTARPDGALLPTAS